MKNIVLSIVNKVNYKEVMHFPARIPYKVLFIPNMVFVACILWINQSNSICVQAKGVKEQIFQIIHFFTVTQ